MTIGLEEHVRQGGAEGCMARDDVGGRGLHNRFGIKQGGVEIVHKGLALMTGPQMPALLWCQDPRSGQGPNQNSRWD